MVVHVVEVAGLGFSVIAVAVVMKDILSLRSVDHIEATVSYTDCTARFFFFYNFPSYLASEIGYCNLYGYAHYPGVPPSPRYCRIHWGRQLGSGDYWQ